MEEKEIPRAESGTPHEESGIFRLFQKGESMTEYKIGDKTFFLQTDFTYAELEWLDVVYERLSPAANPLAPKSGATPLNKGGLNEIKGNFTRDEIEKTLKILLIPNPSLSLPFIKGEGRVGFEHEDFLLTRESQCVKIIADFFLTRAVLGFFMKSFLKN